MDIKDNEFIKLLTRAEAISKDAVLRDGTNLSEALLFNNYPYRLFRQSVDIEVRREAGTFFSDEGMANRLVNMLPVDLPINAVVMDPTCGIGDLLLAYAAKLPIGSTLNETIQKWGSVLSGFDLRSDLIRMTKARLVASARVRGNFSIKDPIPDDVFPFIQEGDMLLETVSLGRVDAFLLNPPFGQTKQFGEMPWGKGKINAAAIFLDHLIKYRASSVPIAAILPEVLRCGTRYQRFRQHLKSLGVSGPYQSLGRFDTWTDVDVFITLLTTQNEKTLWDSGNTFSRQIIEDHFSVSVGTVVPHRHPEVGRLNPYLCAKSSPAWEKGFIPKSKRRYDGRLFDPPFVVVRRTSSPNDKNRAVATVIVGSNPVAVENHLIVLKPISGGVEVCRNLLDILSSKHTNNFLNQTIRCRHLTTKAVKTIPWRIKNE